MVKMNSDEIDIFNHNVYVDNNNTKLLLNVSSINAINIQRITTYLDDLIFLGGIWVFLLVIWSMLLSLAHSQLEKRVEDLEDNRPEKEPLLSNF